MILDGESIGFMKFKSHKYIKIEPGSHVLTATGLTKGSKWKPMDKQLKFQIHRGETKYIKLDVQYNMDNIRITQSGPKHRIFLTPMNANSAVYEIRETSPEQFQKLLSFLRIDLFLAFWASLKSSMKPHILFWIFANLTFQ